eukprot:COSAG04_NODE_28715_length_274_cov_0.554286_1_plen_40_part_10
MCGGRAGPVGHGSALHPLRLAPLQQLQQLPQQRRLHVQEA